MGCLEQAVEVLAVEGGVIVAPERLALFLLKVLLLRRNMSSTIL